MMEEVKDIQGYNTERTINYQTTKLGTTMLNEADLEYIHRAFGFKMYDVLESAGGRQVLFFPMQFARQRKLDGETVFRFVVEWDFVREVIYTGAPSAFPANRPPNAGFWCRLRYLFTGKL
jgi:hypothetical protein